MEPTSSGRTLRSKRKQTETTSAPTTSSSDSDVKELPTDPAVPSRPKRRSKKFLFSPDKKPKPDAIRAPIPQITQVLSEGDQFAVLANEPIADLRAQFRDQKARKTGTKANPGLFDSLRDYKSDMDAYLQSSAGGAIPGTSRSHAKTLTEIFRVPPELITRGTFDEARHNAILKKRWLLVNIHNYTEFPCQKLIRDCLVHEAVKEIIMENFVFWHQNHDTREGLRFKSHYQVQDYPYLAIIDPRTGEKIKTFGDLNVMKFCNYFSEFLAERPSFDETTSSTASSSHPPAVQRRNSVIFIDPEEEEMQRALKASEEEARARKEREEDIGMDDVLEGFISSDDEESAPPKKKPTKPATTPKIVKEKTPEKVTGAWKEYLGDIGDPEVALKIRLPDGTALDLALPNSSKLTAVSMFVEEKGFGVDKYEMMTSYPKRNLSEMDGGLGLKEAGLGGREMLIVQARD